jgi:hypothetical protein
VTRCQTKKLCLCQDFIAKRFYKPQDSKIFELLPAKPKKNVIATLSRSSRGDVNGNENGSEFEPKSVQTPTPHVGRSLNVFTKVV